jgi:hypothetical protein
MKLCLCLSRQRVLSDKRRLFVRIGAIQQLSWIGADDRFPNGRSQEPALFLKCKKGRRIRPPEQDYRSQWSSAKRINSRISLAAGAVVSLADKERHADGSIRPLCFSNAARAKPETGSGLDAQGLERLFMHERVSHRLPLCSQIKQVEKLTHKIVIAAVEDRLLVTSDSYKLGVTQF